MESGRITQTTDSHSQPYDTADHPGPYTRSGNPLPIGRELLAQYP